MSVYSASSRLAADAGSARACASRRAIESLPEEIQKDIGWPDSHSIRLAARRHGRA